MTDSKLRRPCPVCGESRVRRWFREDGASIGRCRGCGTLYTYEPCTESPAEYFKEEYFRSDSHLETVFGSYRVDAFEQFGEILRTWKSGGRILDIGCAAGDFLATLDPTCWERVGVEPSVFAVRKARERGLHVIQGAFGSVPLPEDHFDAVTMLDMLGHLEDPRRVLHEVRAQLLDDGVLMVEIPGLAARLLKQTGPVSFAFGRRWSRLNPRDFVFFPSGRTMRRLIAEAGLELVSIHDVRPNRHGTLGTQRSLEFYYRLARALGRATGGRLMLATKIVYVARRPTASAV